MESLKRKLSTTVCLHHSAQVSNVQFVLMTLQNCLLLQKKKGREWKPWPWLQDMDEWTRIWVVKCIAAAWALFLPPPVITLPSVWVDLLLGHHWYCLILTKHVGHSPDIAGNVSLCDKTAVPICLGGFYSSAVWWEIRRSIKWSVSLYAALICSKRQWCRGESLSEDLQQQLNPPSKTIPLKH